VVVPSRAYLEENLQQMEKILTAWLFQDQSIGGYLVVPEEVEFLAR
jgi:hypothetical protein